MTGFVPYRGVAPIPDSLHWNINPVLVTVLVGVSVANRTVARRRRTISRDLSACFLGWLILSLALISPLCNLSVALFSARITQHMVIVLIAAPLIARGPILTPLGRRRASTRFSPLDQINQSNVGRLQAAWMFSVGTDHGQEAAPLVIDDTMYVESSYPNKVFALDATNGELKWTYIPNTNRAAQGVACCDVVTRGMAYDDGKIFLVTLDNHAIALDAKTGQEQWATQTGEINLGETTTAAPFVVKGKVFVGISGGELGVRGRVTALDEATGKIDYIAYSTGPDKDVLIGPDFKPFYDLMKGKDLGVSTWPPDAWKIGGGTMWGWFSYDPDLNLIYYGTSNPGPWNANQRPGDNLWSTTLFARDPESGAAHWAYQFNPHDLWDHDEIQEDVLVDLDVGGKPRKVLLHPGAKWLHVYD